MDLLESARRLGHYRWFQMRLFEVIGGWVADTDDDALRVHFSAVSRHQAWQADQWAARLPVLREVDPDAATAPGGAGVARFVEELRALGGANRLAALQRCALPALAAALAAHRERCEPGADGPTIRTLGMVLADLEADWLTGEVLLARLLVRGVGLDDLRPLERLLAEAGGVAGPGTV